MRDDFNAAVVRDLGRRVAYICSNPDCKNQTIGPQQEDDGAVVVGIAAHIHAASPGGARYDVNQSSEERSSQDNGIWLCEICAKLVDADAKRFPADLLRAWKNAAENAARNAIGKSPTSATTVHVNQGEEQRPRLDVNGVSASGGAGGHTIFFEVRNDGAAASNIVATLEADDATPEILDVPTHVPPNQQTHLVGHDVTRSDFFIRKLQNPRIVLRYASAEGITFESNRGLVQTLRADGNFNLSESGSYTDRANQLAIEIETPAFSPHARDASGLALSFSITIPILVRNHSRDSLNLRGTRLSLSLPSGYQSHAFGNGFADTENIPGRQVVEKSAQFNISVIGYGQGNGNASLEENLGRLAESLSSEKIVFTLATRAVSLSGAERIECSFDMTADLLPEVRQ